MTDPRPEPPTGRRQAARAPLYRRVLLACALAAVPAAAVALGAPGGGIGEASAQQGQRPNVVLIYTDDQDIRSMRVMPLVEQHLARAGVTFRRHVTTLSHCCPSRATLLTGQYTHNHEVFSGRPPDGGWEKLEDSTTVAVALQRAGYRTAHLGKYLNGYERLRPDQVAESIPPGWSTWFALIDWQMFGWRANINGRLRQFNTPAQYQTDVLKRRAMAFIRNSSAANQPFFVKISTLAPHLEPHVRWRLNPRAPRRHEGRFSERPLRVGPAFDVAAPDKPLFVRNRRPLTQRQQRRLATLNRNRLESLLSVDELVRDVVVQLRRLGQLDNTYLIFTSDNGFMLGEHRQTGKNRLYDPSIRVPLVIRGPGIPAGVTRHQLTSNIDLAPTIFDVTGAEPLVEPDGISMMPAARAAGVDADRQILLTTSAVGRGHSVGIRAPRWMYAEHRPPEGEEGLIEYELYDMNQDPHQLQNLALFSHPEDPNADPDLTATRQRLRVRMEQLLRCAGNSPPRSCR